MANLPQQNTIVQYQADGVTDSYAFNFYVPINTDVNVYVTPATEVPVPSQDLKILNTDYTVSTNVNIFTGGYITFLPGKIPAIGTTVTLSRDVKASLDVEFSNATTLNGENLDEAFERLLLLIQQNKTLINSEQQRVLSYVVNAFQTPANISAQTQLPVLADNQIWVGTGTGIEAVTVDEQPSISTLRTQLLDAASGEDGARRVGFYDAVNNLQTTVQAYLAAIPTQIQNHTNRYAAATGSPTTLTADLTPPLTAYAAGQTFTIRAASDNTGATTLNINSLGPKSIVLSDGLPLNAGDIGAGINAVVTYDGTNFQLINPRTLLNRKFVGSSIQLTVPTIIPVLTTAKLLFNIANYDTLNWFDATNNRITPTIAGYVLVNTNVYANCVLSNGVQGDLKLKVYKNGAEHGTVGGGPVTGYPYTICGSCIMPVNGTTDYIEVWATNNNANNQIAFNAPAVFEVVYMGR